MKKYQVFIIIFASILLCYTIWCVFYVWFYDQDSSANSCFMIIDKNGNIYDKFPWVNYQIYNEGIYRNFIDYSLKIYRITFNDFKEENNKQIEHQKYKIIKKKGIGLIDDKGNTVIETNKSEIRYMDKNIYVVCEKKSNGDNYNYLYDVEDKKIIFEANQFGGFSEGLIPFEYSFHQWGYVDLSGNVIIKPNYTSANSFSDGIAGVGKKINNEYLHGYINKNNEVVLPFKYEYSGDCKGGIILVSERNNKYYYYKIIEVFYTSPYLWYYRAFNKK